MKFGDFAFAAAMRDFIRDEVRSQVNKLRPPAREAVVVSINSTAYTATVQFLDEPDGDAIPVRMSAIQPTVPGQVVRVEGPRGDRFIAAVYGETNISGGTVANEVVIVNSLFGLGGFLTFAKLPASWVGQTVMVDVGLGIGWDDTTGCSINYTGTIEDPPGSGIFITPDPENLPWEPTSRVEISVAAVTLDEGEAMPMIDPAPFTYVEEFNVTGRTAHSFNYLEFGPLEIDGDYMVIFPLNNESNPAALLDYPEPTYPDADPQFGSIPTPIGLYRVRLVT